MGKYKEQADIIFDRVKQLAEHIASEEDKASMNIFLDDGRQPIEQFNELLVSVNGGASFEEAGVQMGPNDNPEAVEEAMNDHRDQMIKITTRNFESAPSEIREQVIQQMHALMDILTGMKQEIDELYAEEQARNRPGMG